MLKKIVLFLAKHKLYVIVMIAIALVLQAVLAPLTLRHLLHEQEKCGATRDKREALTDLARELKHTLKVLKMATASLVVALYLTAIKLGIFFRGLFGTL